MNIYLKAKQLNPHHIITSSNFKDIDSALLTEEVEMEQVGHDKDILYFEIVKTSSQPNPRCYRCGGRGHKGYLTRKKKGEDTSGFVLCSCVLR